MTYTYETQSCPRCGGTGAYSYCQRYGTKCFKCAGAGRTLTRRGAAARAKVRAKREELCSVAVADLRVGDVFLDRERWRTIVAISEPTIGAYVGAEMTPVLYVYVTTKTRVIGLDAGGRVVKSCPEHVETLRAYAASLKGCSVAEEGQ